MKILVINCGSSSLKYQLIDSDTEKVLAKGLCERIGIDGMFTYQKAGCDKQVSQIDQPDHKKSVQLVIDALTDKENGVVADLSEIGAVGHRVVHGGEKFASSVLITEEVIKAIEECNDLAPLHNPANIIGINACRELMPGVPMVAVFDTAFHQTMPAEAFLYGIPYEYYKKYGVRKYGFHGTSHSYVSKRVIDILGLEAEKSKIVVCHLGNGASICAVDGGKSVETSMGLTPLMGLIMGTRSGEIDPGAMEFIANKEGLNLSEVMTILNKRSGVLGLSGVSSDFRDIETAIEDGNEQAKAAMDAFVHRVVSYVGGYIAVMGGVDAIVFTAGIGENDKGVRKAVIEKFGYLGVKLDEEANNSREDEVIISTPDSKVKVLKVATNEELMIARDTLALAK
ncbi:MAG: acetate kinase [Lachnospiraceae bacterium]|nr:acetate kinase [Lachnospiraceae bacterium]MBR6349260.1 acetate kinase [Lachnospiraceae bacterium]